MTLKQLNEHLELVEEFNDLFTVTQQLRDSAGLKAHDITGMPHGTCVNDAVGRIVADISRMEERLSELSTMIETSAAPIEDWINSVESVFTQNYFRLRFLHGMPWQEVADRIGGGNTVQSVQMQCYRQLENCTGHGKKREDPNIWGIPKHPGRGVKK